MENETNVRSKQTKWRDHICTHIQASIHVRHGEAVEGFFQSML